MTARFGNGLDHNARRETFKLPDQFRVVLRGVRPNQHLHVPQVPGANPFGEMESAKMFALDKMRRANGINDDGSVRSQTMPRAKCFPGFVKTILEKNIELRSADDMDRVIAAIRIILLQL